MSMDLAAGVLDVSLGLAAVLVIAVLVARQRRRARSGAESREEGAQRLVGRRRIAPGRAGAP
jgi:membrane protein implicated in regulation of membrane protease activity